jgi:hypothetical protein
MPTDTPELEQTASGSTYTGSSINDSSEDEGISSSRFDGAPAVILRSQAWVTASVDVSLCRGLHASFVSAIQVTRRLTPVPMVMCSLQRHTGLNLHVSHKHMQPTGLLCKHHHISSY